MRSLTERTFGDRYLGYSHDYKLGDSSHSLQLEESATWANTASELASIRTQLLIPGARFFVIVGRLPPRLYGAWLSDVEIPPARAAFEAAALPRGAAVEIVAQAHEDA